MQASNAGREMTTGEAIVEALKVNGVDTLFGLPGAQMYALFDALQRESGSIRTVGARHEQGCGYMAFGYARSTGRPGVFSVVPGPGVLNTTAALCTAMGCAAPVLCITGEVPSAFLGQGRGHLHELSDQRGTIAKLVKWTARIERAADAPAIINEAFRQMLTGRPGPVMIEAPWDVMAQKGFVRTPVAATFDAPDEPSPLEVEAAAKLLLSAKHPMILTGSGAQHAAADVRALAEELGAPVSALRGGRGIIAESEPLGMSSYAAYRLWPEVDVVVGIGTRMEMPYMRWTGMMKYIDVPDAPPHVIRIDIDPVEMRKFKPHAGIVADSALGARALLEAVRRLGRKKTKPDPSIAREKKIAAEEVKVVQPQFDYLAAIRSVLPDDGIYVPEVSQMGFASWFAWDVRKPRTYISEGFQGTLGFGFPTALGVKVAHPDTPVVSVVGDGGFQFGIQELATAAQENIALVTIVFNNKSFGNVLRDQKLGFNDRRIGSELKNPDFMKLADAYGVEGHRVDSPAALIPVLKAALDANKPVLIEVELAQGAETSPWEFIHFKGWRDQSKG